MVRRAKATQARLAALKKAEAKLQDKLAEPYMPDPKPVGEYTLTWSEHKLTLVKSPERDDCTLYSHMSAEMVWVAVELPFVSICNNHLVKEAMDGNVHTINP